MVARPFPMCAQPRRSPFCDDCEFHLGVGGTYHSFEATGGVVIPMTMSWDRESLGIRRVPFLRAVLV